MARLVLAAGAEARADDTDDSGGAQPGSASQWSSLALRALAYILLAALALVGYRRVLAVAGAYAGEPVLLLWPLALLTALYVAAVWLVLRTRPAASRAARLAELGLLLALGVVLRGAVFGTAPDLSHDAYRYAWDPYLLAHGVSPYLHTPSDPALLPLRDGAIWPQLNWRTSPTIYPPGAQAFFLLVYLVAPLNIFAVKAAMVLCDAGVALLALVLLRRRRLDARRVLIYWWSPLPVLEFALNGHLDVVAILLTLAALVVAEQRWRGARAAAGMLLGVATLTKLYPLLFVLALVRPAPPLADGQPHARWRRATLSLRQNADFLAALTGTLVAGYLPFAVAGLSSTGFLGTYLSQRFGDQGIVSQVLAALAGLVGGSTVALALLQLAALAGLCAAVVWWRGRRPLRPEAGVLVLSAVWLALSPHLYPWYVAALLPLLALYLRLPRRTPARAGEAGPRESAPALALWLFVLALPFSYVIFAPGGPHGLFSLSSLVPLALVVLAYGSTLARRLAVASRRIIAALPV